MATLQSRRRYQLYCGCGSRLAQHGQLQAQPAQFVRHRRCDAGNTGIIFNCRGDYYSLVRGEANALAPGKRPRSTLQSTLIMKGGQPYAILGSPGGDDQVMRTMQTLINMVDFGMNIQQAIEAPRWSSRSFPASPFPHTMHPGDLSAWRRASRTRRVKALAARGHQVHVAPPWSLGSERRDRA